MEIRFRPMPPGTLARRVTPGQESAEGAESFTEVVASLTTTDETPGQNPNSGHNRQEPPPQDQPPPADAEPVEEEAEQGTTSQEESPAPAAGKTGPEGKPLGKRLDLTG